MFISHHHRVPGPLAERQGSQRTAVGGKKEDYRSKQHDHMTLLIKSLSSLYSSTSASTISFFSFAIHTVCVFVPATAFPTHFQSFNWPPKKVPSLPHKSSGIYSCMHKDINCFLSLHHQLTH